MLYFLRTKSIAPVHFFAQKEERVMTNREEIIHMPNYFEPYDTTVNFITEEELKKIIVDYHMVVSCYAQEKLVQALSKECSLS